jgi:hypothetical protein
MGNYRTPIMTPITIWQRQNDNKVMEHNHIEDGHVPSSQLRPTPKTEEHKKAWARGVWSFSHAHLSNDTPPKII